MFSTIEILRGTNVVLLVSLQGRRQKVFQGGGNEKKYRKFAKNIEK